MIAVSLAMLLAPLPVLADLGPEPTIEEFAGLAEAELAKKLRPDQSIVYTWPYRLVAGPAGYYTCGRAQSARSARRGGKDLVWVSAVVHHGQAVRAQWSTLNGMLAYECKGLVKKGTLVPR